MKFKSISFFVLTFTMLSLCLGTAWADRGRDVITIDLAAPGNSSAYGTAIVVSDRGPDIFRLRTFGLEPRTSYTVFLTESATPGTLPAQFIGEFRTNRRGSGRLSLRAEIVSTFASANQSAEDSLGIGGVGSGALLNGANTIPLNYIRVYLAKGVGNVFGPNEEQPGGPIALISQEPLP